eukprot:8017672-Alexandrium_andersonii.AAC.1
MLRTFEYEKCARGHTNTRTERAPQGREDPHVCSGHRPPRDEATARRAAAEWGRCSAECAGPSAANDSSRPWAIAVR